MLIFSRKEDEALVIDGCWKLTIIDIHKDEIRFMLRKMALAPQDRGLKARFLSFIRNIRNNKIL